MIPLDHLINWFIRRNVPKYVSFLIKEGCILTKKQAKDNFAKNQTVFYETPLFLSKNIMKKDNNCVMFDLISKALINNGLYDEAKKELDVNKPVQSKLNL